jgi:cob(I)alamin adenosyltransferase
MPRITKVYTRTGDDGSTGLGVSRRVAKDDPRVEAYGTVDELSSVLGVALAEGLSPSVASALTCVQNDLFHLGSDLCVPDEDKAEMPVPQIEERHIDQLEAWMDEWSAGLPPLENFILPGGSRGASLLHWARTVCRRAERRLVSLAREESVGAEPVRYLNRLSDLLFVAARFENAVLGVAETTWDSRR